MIVVDTNVVVYLLVNSELTDAARAALARDPAWAAPPLLRSEFRNVLVTHLRRGHLDLDEAAELQTMAEELVGGREFSPDSGRVLELASKSGRSAYDCEFVAVAQTLGVPLVTSDRQLVRSFPGTAVSLAVFAVG